MNKHPLGQVVAAQDIHAGRLQELRAKFHIPKAFETATEFFADSHVDAVYIAVPNKLHAPLAVEAFAAGKHVILEKPFARNAAEAITAIDAARASGQVLAVGMNQRSSENAQNVLDLASHHIFGDIYHAKAAWTRRAGIPKLGTWFGSRDLAGGGCLYDIGVHVLDLSLYVIDDFEPVSVFGSTYAKFGTRGLGGGSWGNSDDIRLPFEVEDFASGQIRMADGCTISLDVTWARHAEESDRVEADFWHGGGRTGLCGQSFPPGRPARLALHGDQPPGGSATSAFRPVSLFHQPHPLRRAPLRHAVAGPRRAAHFGRSRGIVSHGRLRSSLNPAPPIS